MKTLSKINNKKKTQQNMIYSTIYQVRLWFLKL